MKNIINYGVIGCGEHACRGHIDHGRDAGMRLVSVFDPSEEAARRAIKSSGNKKAVIASSVAELIRHPQIEAVLIASPDKFHPEQLERAVKAGKHVLIDKPLAIDFEGLHTVNLALAIAREKKLVITSCHPRRFDPSYIWVKQNLEKAKEEFGTLISVDLDFSYHMPSETWKHSRSLLLDHFPHEIDYLHFLLGRNVFEAWRLVDEYNVYSVAGRRHDGVMFSFKGTRMLRSSVYPETISLRFARGGIVLDTKSGIATVQSHETGKSRKEKAMSTDYDRRFCRLALNFARAIRGEEVNYLDFEDLQVNNESAIVLASVGRYRYGSMMG